MCCKGMRDKAVWMMLVMLCKQHVRAALPYIGIMDGYEATSNIEAASDDPALMKGFLLMEAHQQDDAKSVWI